MIKMCINVPYSKTKKIIKSERFDCSDDMVSKYKVSVTYYRYREPEYSLRNYKTSSIVTYDLSLGDWVTIDDEGYTWVISDEDMMNKYKKLPSVPSAVSDLILMHNKMDEEMSSKSNIVSVILSAVEYYYPNSECGEWIEGHGNEFARAWLDGFKITK